DESGTEGWGRAIRSHSHRLVRPHAEEHRSASEHRRFHRLGALRCVSKHEGHAVVVLILRDARTRVRLYGSACARALLRIQLTMSNSPSRSRGVCLRPGFASLLHSPRIEGWAERRETFGCSAEHPWGLHVTRQARRLRGALRPMTRQCTGRDNVTISMPGGGSVPIVSQTAIEPMKMSFSLMLALVTATALTEPLPVPKPPGPGGSCSHGYIASGSFCTPSCTPSTGASDAITKPSNGTCPWGWI